MNREFKKMSDEDKKILEALQDPEKREKMEEILKKAGLWKRKNGKA